MDANKIHKALVIGCIVFLIKIFQELVIADLAFLVLNFDTTLEEISCNFVLFARLHDFHMSSAFNFVFVE
jgi:hypothetical protein